MRGLVWVRYGPGSQFLNRRSEDPRLPLEGNGRRGRACQDDVGLQAHQFFREYPHPVSIAGGPTNIDAHVAAIGPTQARKRLRERRVVTLRHGIVFAARHEHADASYPVGLLCIRREPPSSALAAGRFGKQDFVYVAADDLYCCPASERLTYRFTTEEAGKMLRRYWTTACETCALK